MNGPIVQEFLVGEMFAFMILFCRIGTGIMLMPGIGESYVPMRARLLFALAVCIVLRPVLDEYLPPIPDSPFGLGILVTGEIVAGVFLGMLVRLLIAVTHTAGMIIAYQSSLAAAMMFDYSAGTQGSVFGNLLGGLATLLFFALDLHHVMLGGFYDSYSLIVPGDSLPWESMADYMGAIVTKTFAVAFQIASPFIAVGLIFYLGAGVLARLMPQMQVFFIVIPAQIMLSLFLLVTCLSGMMLWYMAFVEEAMTGFLAPL